MAEFKKLIACLKRHYGDPVLPPAKGPFELILWENACYLLPDHRRAAGAGVGRSDRSCQAVDRRRLA